MDGVMIEGYGQRFGERLRVQNARAMITRVLRSVTGYQRCMGLHRS